MLLVFAKWEMGGASFSLGALHAEATFLLCYSQLSHANNLLKIPEAHYGGPFFCDEKRHPHVLVNHFLVKAAKNAKLIQKGPLADL